MKILCVCDEGNNRSVTLAHQLKYLGHDVLSAGLNTNTSSTIIWLMGTWAEKVIITEPSQRQKLTFPDDSKIVLWDIGPDVYPRPFNKELLKIVRRLISEHRHELEH